MAAVNELTPALGAGAACRALGLWRGAPSRQRTRAHRATLMGPPVPRTPRTRPPLALDAVENQSLLDTLNSDRFVDTAPAAVHATLLDEGRYLGSVRTMYRLLAANGGCRERRNQLTHPAYTKPELLAIAPAITSPAQPLALPSPPRGEVAFDDVRFSYPTRLAAPALHGIRLLMTLIPAGAALAAIAILGWYPLDEARLDRIQRDLRDRRRPAGTA